MKLHHLRTAFLVICWVLVCSQARSQSFGIDSCKQNLQDDLMDDNRCQVNLDIINNNAIAGTLGQPVLTQATFASTSANALISDSNNNTGTINNNALFGTSGQSVQDTNALISDSNNNIDNFDVNLDPAVPEPTTLSLLTMSLLFAGRRWR